MDMDIESSQTENGEVLIKIFDENENHLALQECPLFGNELLKINIERGKSIYLSQEQVKAILPNLQTFAQTGKLI
jgi:hypothetical protein